MTMQGHAFKCDECNRVQFVPDYQGPASSPPPKGWFALSQVPDLPDADMIVWPLFHFCQYDCLDEFVSAMRGAVAVDVDADGVPEPETLMKVLSAWDAEEVTDDDFLSVD